MTHSAYSVNKRCHSCGLDKLLYDFNKSRFGKHGVTAICKICYSEPQIPGATRKFCNLCGQFKLFDDFHKSASGKYGRYNICKVCRLTPKIAPVDVTHRICNTCNLDKLLTDFHKSKVGLYGRRANCKDCVNLANRSKIYPRKLTGIKQCYRCKESKSVNEFGAGIRRKDGLYSYCKTCNNNIRIATESTLDGFIRNLFNHIRNRGKERPCEITEQDIHKLYRDQEGICVKTGMSLNHKKTYSPDNKQGVYPEHYYNMSVDRINSDKHYTLDNVQLVTFGYNYIKWNRSDIDTVKWCCLIREHQTVLERVIELMMVTIVPSKISVKFMIVHETLRPCIHKYIRFMYKKTVRELKHRTKHIEFHITLADLINLYERQAGCCALSGVKMTTNDCRDTKAYRLNRGNYTNISIDRINSQGDYTIENIQLVCVVVNPMKGEMPQNIFLDFCKAVAEHNT